MTPNTRIGGVDHELECAISTYGLLIERANRKGDRKEAKRLRQEFKKIVEEASLKWRASRQQQIDWQRDFAICPQCRGERRIKGHLCSRCNGDAQIPRSSLKKGEQPPFEAMVTK